MRVSERWIILGIAVLMVLVLAILARVLGNSREREDNLTALMLDRALNSQHQQIRLVAESYVKDLRQEATYIRMHQPVNDSALLDRWLPLMQDHNAIRAIRLADDQGNEWILHHPDSAWQWMLTKRQDTAVYSMAAAWFGNGEIPEPAPAATRPDPRETDWYSTAIGSHGDEPVWSQAEPIAGNGVDSMGSLQLSKLVLVQGGNGPLHVLSFSLAGTELLANVAERGPRISGLALNARWQPISTLDSGTMGAAWRQLLQDRKRIDLEKPFHPVASDPQLLGKVGTLHLNGTTLQTGVIISIQEVDQLNRQRSVGLWALMGLLMLLSVLLSLVFIQRRGAERREAQQTRRSKLQARHLEKVMTEREVLDREVHHRVKNNLQVVSSLLNIQAQRVPDEGARREFVRGKRRIDSMALVHHKLYRQNDLSAVDLHEFLDDIAKAMAAMFAPQSSKVGHTVDTQGIRCDADTSIQLGMVLCELLANCHQHAFPFGTGGQIHISVRNQGPGVYQLVVQDNGQGFSSDAVKDSQLGLEVVEALSEQLDGTMRVTSDSGTRVEINFRSNEGS